MQQYLPGQFYRTGLLPAMTLTANGDGVHATLALDLVNREVRREVWCLLGVREEVLHTQALPLKV